jgi:hypothetical protein
MAISNAINGIEVIIHVDGKPAQEYDCSDSKKDAITKYIEAIPDAPFEVQIRMGRKYFPTGKGLRMRVYVDGTKASGQVIYSKRDSDIRVRGHESSTVSDFYVRPFRFGALATSICSFLIMTVYKLTHCSRGGYYGATGRFFERSWRD